MFFSLESASKFLNGSGYFYISVFALCFVPFGFPIAGSIALAMFLVVTFLDQKLGKTASKEDKITLARLEAALFAFATSIVIVFVGWDDVDFAPIGEFLMVLGFHTVIYIPTMVILMFAKLTKVRR